MTCHKVSLPGGGFAIACTRGERSRKCQDCIDAKLRWPRVGAFQCDGPAAHRKTGTCGRYVCAQCKTGDGKRDLCKRCVSTSPQKELFEVAR